MPESEASRRATLIRNAIEDLTGWLSCNDANVFEKIGGCNTCGKLYLAYNGIGDREAIAIAKGLGLRV